LGHLALPGPDVCSVRGAAAVGPGGVGEIQALDGQAAYRRYERRALEDLRAILAGRTAFCSKAELHVDTSAQDLAATFAILRAGVRQAIAVPD
jgi:hypothetical protein